MSSRKARFEIVPAMPPSCTNSAVTVRHRSPWSPCGVRCSASSMPRNTSPSTLVVAVTTKWLPEGYTQNLRQAA
jgi:hypothetical protein